MSSWLYSWLGELRDAIPFARSQTFDLDGYVVDKGLAGLFHVLGDQEKQIRRRRIRARRDAFAPPRNVRLPAGEEVGHVAAESRAECP